MLGTGGWQARRSVWCLIRPSLGLFIVLVSTLALSADGGRFACRCFCGMSYYKVGGDGVAVVDSERPMRLAFDPQPIVANDGSELAARMTESQIQRLGIFERGARGPNSFSLVEQFSVAAALAPPSLLPHEIDFLRTRPKYRQSLLGKFMAYALLTDTKRALTGQSSSVYPALDKSVDDYVRKRGALSGGSTRGDGGSTKENGDGSGLDIPSLNDLEKAEQQKVTVRLFGHLGDDATEYEARAECMLQCRDKVINAMNPSRRLIPHASYAVLKTTSDPRGPQDSIVSMENPEYGLAYEALPEIPVKDQHPDQTSGRWKTWHRKAHLRWFPLYLLASHYVPNEARYHFAPDTPEKEEKLREYNLVIRNPRCSAIAAEFDALNPEVTSARSLYNRNVRMDADLFLHPSLQSGGSSPTPPSRAAYGQAIMPHSPYQRSTGRALAASQYFPAQISFIQRGEPEPHYPRHGLNDRQKSHFVPRMPDVQSLAAFVEAETKFPDSAIDSVIDSGFPSHTQPHARPHMRKGGHTQIMETNEEGAFVPVLVGPKIAMSNYYVILNHLQEAVADRSHGAMLVPPPLMPHSPILARERLTPTFRFRADVFLRANAPSSAPQCGPVFGGSDQKHSTSHSPSHSSAHEQAFIDFLRFPVTADTAQGLKEAQRELIEKLWTPRVIQKLRPALERSAREFKFVSQTTNTVRDLKNDAAFLIRRLSFDYNGGLYLACFTAKSPQYVSDASVHAFQRSLVGHTGLHKDTGKRDSKSSPGAGEGLSLGRVETHATAVFAVELLSVRIHYATGESTTIKAKSLFAHNDVTHQSDIFGIEAGFSGLPGLHRKANQEQRVVMTFPFDLHRVASLKGAARQRFESQLKLENPLLLEVFTRYFRDLLGAGRVFQAPDTEYRDSISHLEDSRQSHRSSTALSVPHPSAYSCYRGASEPPLKMPHSPPERSSTMTRVLSDFDNVFLRNTCAYDPTTLQATLEAHDDFSSTPLYTTDDRHGSLDYRLPLAARDTLDHTHPSTNSHKHTHTHTQRHKFDDVGMIAAANILAKCYDRVLPEATVAITRRDVDLLAEDFLRNVPPSIRQLVAKKSQRNPQLMRCLDVGYLGHFALMSDRTSN